MSDEVTPVRRVIITHSQLKDPVALDLPWELLPEAAKRDLSKLDRNKDGDLYFTIDGGVLSPRREIGFGDGTAKKFFRWFWAFQGDSPYNNSPKDEASRSERLQKSRLLQNQLFERVVEPLLLDSKNIKRWEEAKRVIGTFASPAHLLTLAKRAEGQAKGAAHDHFLYISEDLLLEAKRLAAATRWGRREYFSEIDQNLRTVSVQLDRIDQNRFREAIREPYLLLGSGAPKTIRKEDLEKGKDFLIPVSVPKGYPKEKIAAALNQQKVRIKPSLFRGGRSTEEYRLQAGAVYSLNHIAPNQSAQIRFQRQSKLLFEEARDYYWVSFSLPQVPPFVAGLDSRKFDLVSDLASGRTREIKGSLVLQDKRGKSVHVAFASDLHISERDYEIVKVMVDSLSKERPVPHKVIERVERFYETFNEKLEVAIEHWNDAYRKGRLDKVILAGDLVDFINIATTSAAQSYRGTNVRRLVHILSKLEAPLYTKPGNHDVRIYPYPKSVFEQGYADNPELYKLYKQHYDSYRFSGFFMELHGLKALMTRRFLDPQNRDPKASMFLSQALGELLSDDPYAKPSDEGLRPYHQHLDMNEADLTPLAPKLYLYHWRTNEDDFNHQRFVFEKINEPVGLNQIRSLQKYLLNKHVNGKGPRPNTFRHFLQTLEQLKRADGEMILAGHFPPFYLGKGPDQTPDSEDSLRGEVNWALRLATWYYRHPDGRPVVSMVVSGHVHRYGEYSLESRFSAKERAEFQRELGAIFKKIISGEIKEKEIYNHFHNLRLKYTLDPHLTPQRHLDTGQGVPGPLVDAFNRDSMEWGKKNGTLFVNLPAKGPGTSDSPSGEFRLAVSPENKKKLQIYYTYLEKDGSVLRGSSDKFAQLKIEHRRRIVEWKISHREAPTTPKDSDSFSPPEPESPKEQIASAFKGPPLFDLIPWACQHARKKSCLGAGVGLGFKIQGPEFGSHFELIPAQVTIPLSNRHHSLLGLNYARVYASYLTAFHTWNVGLRVGLGLPEPYFAVGTKFNESRNLYTAGILVGAASSQIIPAVNVAFHARGDRSAFAGTVSLLWMVELLSVKLNYREHRH